MQGELKNGMTKLDHVLKAVASNVDALALLGQLFPHVRTSFPAQRLARLREGASSHPDNAAIQVRWNVGFFF